VIAVENEIRMNKTFETAVAFDKNGNVVIDKRGEARKVEFTDEECRVVKDCVFTHNHPSGWNAKEGTIGRIGNSFSIQDISFAIGNDVAEIRAVTPTYTFVMKRPTNGWGMGVANLKKEYNQIEAEIRKNTNKAVYGASTRQEMELAADRANASFFHLVWKKFSKKHGIEYNKKKTK
jgi:hypothetical protein